MTLEQQLAPLRAQVEAYLREALPETPCSQARLYDAMRYSLLAGGKRVRPVLTLLFCRAAGGDAEAALPFGCGVEMLHTYSLIHDDLPCMDNDALRRGKPTNHVVYGECLAVLAGDALQAAAFEQILSAPLPGEVRAQAALELARGAGKDGMCAGQTLDMEGEGRTLSLEELTRIHRHKTGALLEAACVLGVLAAGGTPAQLAAARAYAGEIGLAFQIRDDLLDCISTTQQLGKPVGSDAENEKTTYVTLLGVEGSKRQVEAHTRAAQAALREAFPEETLLIEFADWLAGRNY